MRIQETLYKMSLVGAVGGLLAWAVTPLLPALIPALRIIPQERYWVATTLDLVLIGLLIGGMCIGFADYWEMKKVVWWRLLAGTGYGFLAGGSGGLLLYAAQLKWSAQDHPLQTPILTWLVTGASIGLAISVRRYGLLMRRALFSLLGGAIGATAGGVLLGLVGERLPYVTHAFGLMITGAGIAFGSTSAVVIMRNALIKLVHAEDPKVLDYFNGRKQEWELLRGDTRVFGNAENHSKSKAYLYIPDEKMAPLHAEIYEEGGSFYVTPHPDNCGPSGPVYTLKVKDPGGAAMTDINGPKLLQHGAEILMGSTTFIFQLRGRGGVKGLMLIAILTAATLTFSTPTFAQATNKLTGARLVPTDKVRLLQCEPNSERPCFRITVNIVDRDGQVLPVRVLGNQQAMQQAQVYEGDSPLTVFHARLTYSGDHPQRFAILLVDVSGSMLEPASDGRTKFVVMKEACTHFARDFADGIDHVAVIPFASQTVVTGVNSAIFCGTKQELDAQINRLAMPNHGNTGLFSATLAAIKRLQREREQAIRNGVADPPCLLVVMTDGKNDVNHEGDDKGLLNDLLPVREAANKAGIQVIPVGFGDEGHIDEPALKQLVWPASTKYIPARRAEDLVAAFQTARALQVERVQITFLPKQTLRAQLVNSHEFKVRFNLDSGEPIEGVMTWAYAGLPPSPFEGVLPVEERPPDPSRKEPWQAWLIIYLGTLMVFGWVIYWFWFKAPPRIWPDEYDKRVLLPLALSVIHGNRIIKTRRRHR